MNWLFVGIPLAGLYLLWFAYLLIRRRYDSALLLYALAHLHYLFVNVVAPFRGAIDPGYAGYNFGWLHIPAGPLVPLIVGSIVILSLITASRALLNRMQGWWKLAFGLDLFLSVMIALPVLLDVLGNMSDYRLELGEYLQISGVFVALLILLLFTGPTLYACYYAARKALSPGKATTSA